MLTDRVKCTTTFIYMRLRWIAMPIPMPHATNSMVMARSENMTCIQILIYLQKLQSCCVLWRLYYFNSIVSSYKSISILILFLFHIWPISVSTLFRGKAIVVARSRGRGEQIRETIIMVGKGGPITGGLLHRVAKYSGFQDASVRFSFPVLVFRITIRHSNTIKLGILHVCRWLQHKRWQSNENVIILNVHDG